MALLDVILDFDILQVTEEILVERDPFVSDSVVVLDTAVARIVLPLLVTSASAVTAKKVRVNFSAPVVVNDALIDPTNYIFNVLSAGAIDVIPQSVDVPVGFGSPVYVEVVVSEHTGGASYEVALKSGITGTLDQAGDETPTGYTGVGDPPKVSLVLAVSKTKVVVQFNETLLDEVSVRTPSNYTWDNGLTTISVKEVSGNEVTLETSEQTEGVLYTLNVLGAFEFEFSDTLIVSESLEVVDPGQILWIKAVAADITESAGDVTAWVNRRGSAGSTAGNNPEWISSSPEMGGHGVVRFDSGNTEIFNFNDISADVQGEDLPLTVIAAARFTGDLASQLSGFDPLWSFGHLSDATPPEIYGARVLSTLRLWKEDDAGTVRLRKSFDYLDNNAGIFTFMLKGTEGELFRDLTRLGGTPTSPIDVGVTTPNSFSLGGHNAGTEAGTVFGNWDIAEIMVFKYELSETARKFYVRQMASDKGISLPTEKILDFDSLDNTRSASGGSSTDGTGILENEPVKVYKVDETRVRTFPNGDRYILVEGIRENELTDSIILDDNAVWPRSGVDDVVANEFLSPEGIVNAEKIVSNDSEFTINGIAQALTNAPDPNTEYTLSCYIRKVTADSEYGLAAKILNGAAKRKNVSKNEWPLDTWIRDDFTFDTLSGATPVSVRLVDHSVNLNSTSRRMWGAQTEKGNFPSSFMLSSSAPLVRGNESVVLPIQYASENLQKGIFSFKLIPLWASTEAPFSSTEILKIGGDPAWFLHYEGGRFKITTLLSVDLLETDLVSFERYEEALFQLDGDAGTLIVTGFSGGGGGFAGLPWSGIVDPGSSEIELRNGFYWMSEPE